MTLISFCAIVKNESKNLGRCLTSVQPYVDEIVIVDTGSTDDTVKIAEKFAATIGYFQWRNDFAAARNYALDLVRGTWVLVLDADEELVVIDSNFFQQLNDTNFWGYTLSRKEITQPDGMTPLHTLRLFRNLPELRYHQRFHEDLKYQQKQIPPHKINHLPALEIIHHGYETEQIKQQKNLQRNIPVLEEIKREEGLNLMLLYCLAGMYVDTQQPTKALECYQEAYERLFGNLLEGTPPEDFRFVPSLLFNLAVNLLHANNYQEAEFLIGRGLEWCPNYVPLIYLAAVTQRALDLPEKALEFFDLCLEIGKENSYYRGEPFDSGYLNIYPAYDKGCLLREMEKLEEAKQVFESILLWDQNFSLAQQALDKLALE